VENTTPEAHEREKRHELTWKIPRQKPTKFNYHKAINQSNQVKYHAQKHYNHAQNIKTNEKNAMTLRGIHHAKGPRSSTSTNTLQ